MNKRESISLINNDLNQIRKCKLCGGETTYLFSLPLAHQMLGKYYECKNCQTLQSHHLDALTKDQNSYIFDQKIHSNLDSGAAWRQYCIVRRLKLLSDLRIIPKLKNTRILDYGCGSGFAVSFLRHKYNANIFGYEPIDAPSFSPDRIYDNLEEVIKNGPYQIIIASEVFEHFIDPRMEIKRITSLLKPKQSYLYLTTGLYLPGKRDRNWDYFAPESGQHVTFYSKASMRKISEIIGGKSPLNVGAEYEWLIYLDNSRVKTSFKIFMAALLRLGVRSNLIEKII